MLRHTLRERTVRVSAILSVCLVLYVRLICPVLSVRRPSVRPVCLSAYHIHVLPVGWTDRPDFLEFWQGVWYTVLASLLSRNRQDTSSPSSASVPLLPRVLVAGYWLVFKSTL